MQKQVKNFLTLSLLAMFAFLPLFAGATVTEESGDDTDTSSVNAIVLSGSEADITWEVDGTSPKGFKVVWSKNEHPTYPTRDGDKYHYYSDPNKDSDTLTAFAGSGTYYVRVCEYLGGKCGVYSNEISLQLTIDTNEEETTDNGNVTSISLSANNNVVSWSLDGTSPKGFKVVWSKNEHPTYPTREGDKYHYYSNPNQRADTIKPFAGSGTYYVRVCEYLGGKCGVYSNEISVELNAGSEETETTGNVNKIILSGDDNKIAWEVDGISPKGFKVVWSKNEHPTYPTRDGDKYHYYSDPNKDSDTLTAFAGSGTYYVRVCEYLGGKCGVYSNEISLELAADLSPAVCSTEYKPVCGKDGRTYSNKCVAKNQHGIEVAYQGECKKDEEIKKIEKKAELLKNNKLDEILAELKELRNQVREQQIEIKYLRGLLGDISEVATAIKDSLTNFITYGVDDNTKKLGAGERAAVIYSYKQAFGKLPNNEEELSDIIKIANGRWPGSKNDEAEKRAKEKFQEIYKRIPNMNDPSDSAAIKVMAYGIRQKAQNRKLESERRGIKIFRDIYGHLPQTTEEWNIMQAITYSGATRGIDSDGDLLTDERETELGTDPHNPDTDGDGFADGVEVANGYDPLKK